MGIPGLSIEHIWKDVFTNCKQLHCLKITYLIIAFDAVIPDNVFLAEKVIIFGQITPAIWPLVHS